MLKFDPLTSTGQAMTLAPTEEVGLSLVPSMRVEDDIAAKEDPIVRAFLNDIMDRLAQLPMAMRQEIRRELSVHLDCLIVAHEELGLEHEKAIFAAMDQFGDEATIARRFRRAYQSTEPVATPWPAMRETMRIYAVVIAAYAALSFLGAQVSPESYSINSLCGALVWIIPILVGGWIGRRTPKRAGLGAFLGCSALATVVAPIIVSFVGHLGETVSVYSPLYRLGEYCVQCLLVWPVLSCLSASVTSRIKWGSDLVKSPAAFAVVCLTLGLITSVAEFLMAGLFQHVTGGPLATVRLLIAPLMMAVGSAAPVFAGWRVGKAWPITERWTLWQVVLLVLGGFMAVIGSNVVTLSYLAEAIEHNPLHGGSGIGPFVAGTLRWLFAGTVPLAGVAALIASSKQRGGDWGLYRTVAVGAATWWGVEHLQNWIRSLAYQHPGHPFHASPTATALDNIFSYYLLAAAIFIAVKYRHRLPRWDRLCGV